MKIPSIFVPEKDLDKKIASLSSAKPHKVMDLEDLILWQDSDSFVGFSKMHDHVLKSYSLLDPELVEEKIFIDYASTYVHIMKFLDKESLEFSLKGVIATVNSYNQSILAHCNALFKDEYLVFIYFNLLDHKKKYLALTKGYKKIGFEEVKG